MSWLMQARSTVSEILVAWVSVNADWAGLGFPGPGSPEYIAGTELVGRSVTTGVLFLRTINDTIVTTYVMDPPGLTKTGYLPDDEIITTDEVEWEATMGAGADDTIVVTDSLLNASEDNRFLDETVDMSDDLEWERTSGDTGERIFTDTIAITDELDYSPFHRMHEDTIAIPDQIASQLYPIEDEIEDEIEVSDFLTHTLT